MSGIRYTYTKYRENAHIFSEALHYLFNLSINEATFSSVSKLAAVNSIFKRAQRTLKTITDQSTF